MRKKQQKTEHEVSHVNIAIISRTFSASASGEKNNKARRYIYIITNKQAYTRNIFSIIWENERKTVRQVG